MTVPLRHKHSEQHRGLVPEDQLAAETATAGYVVTATGTGEAEWAPAAASGAPADATYLVGAAHAGLSAEIVVGATPGGELGGTWASPTVDATHSGSAHTDFIAKAIVDAAGDLIVGTGADTVGRLAKGSDGQVLTVDPTTHLLVWATPGAGTNVATDTIWDAAGDLVQGTGSNTAARLALGTALQVLRVNAGATAAEWAAAAAAPTTNIIVDIATPIKATSGVVTLNSTNWLEIAAETGGPGTGTWDLDFTNCQAGDILEMTMSAYVASAAVYAFFDFQTIVSGSAVNFTGGGSGAGTGEGVMGIYAETTREVSFNGTVRYVLVSGDLSAGALKVRPVFRTSTATNRSLFVTTGNPLQISGLVRRP